MNTDDVITPEIISKHGITPDEYERIKQILGREPNITELGIFSVMWSEHCSYKNSRLELKKFPTGGSRILVRAGEENAGIVDIGDGWAIAFKIESHNHPSAVEPFQGAATGVGGIIRDIFTMGARPIAVFDPLRFGPIDDSGVKKIGASATGSDICAANRRLFTGVVAGIAHYGNCIGVPTVGGEVFFDSSYNGNPLVNVLCIGVIRHDQIKRGKATGTGNPVFYVGSATGRDGLAGAAFASRELTEQSHEDRPAVQVGDPFMEKLLLEACLEAMRADGLVVGIQDMGAAGLTCSTCETASRGGSGIEIDLAKVPMRETGMTPYEVMLSESQERMLIIAKRGCEKQLKEVFEKWDLHASEIGQVTADGMMRVKFHGETVAEIPAKALAEEAPVYVREAREPAYIERTRAWSAADLSEPRSYQDILPRLLSSPTIASKNWVWRQYDHMVQHGTVVLPGSDAAVLRINLRRPDLGALEVEEMGRGEKSESSPSASRHRSSSPVEKFIAFSTDCNSTYCYLDPREGGKAAVAEAARNLVCSGARPVAVTDCLNFGNPMKPEIFWQFRGCVEGIAEACRALGTPVTGGNVSFYNESPAGAVDPTPVIGMLGIIDDPCHITTQWFKNSGDTIALLGDPVEDTDSLGLGGSEYIKRIHGLKAGAPPRVDLKEARLLHAALLELIRAGLVRSAHDCSEGGLAVAIAESCISHPDGAVNRKTLIGASIDVTQFEERLDAVLFGESQSRVIVSCRPDALPALRAVAYNHRVAVIVLGTTGGDALKIETRRGRLTYVVSELWDAWYNAIARVMEG